MDTDCAFLGGRDASDRDVTLRTMSKEKHTNTNLPMPPLRPRVVVDAHCDTTQRLLEDGWDFSACHDNGGHVDLPRLREGGIDALFFAIWTPDTEGAAQAGRLQFERIEQLVARHSGDLAYAQGAHDVYSAKAEGKIAILVGLEGGHLIESSVATLHEFAQRGATYMTLTHGFHTTWADSAGLYEDLAPRHGGLTDEGRDMVREMNRLGMMVDVSHVSDQTFWDVLDIHGAPVVATHSCCRSVCDHRRNMTDDMMVAVAESGGVVCMNFSPLFVDPDFPDPKLVQQRIDGGLTLHEALGDYAAPLSRVVDHFDHAIGLVGYEHVGIGSDFDGVATLPDGLQDCSQMPGLISALMDRGHKQADLDNVLGNNLLRVMAACQALAEL